ncbi:MAG: serine/threonine-protein kinase [Candidatus Adiutricales bacterium]
MDINKFIKKIKALFLPNATYRLERDSTSPGLEPRVRDGLTSSKGKHTLDLNAGLEDIKIVGRYEIMGKLGQGGTGIVYLGKDPYIKRYVAIKISQPTSDQAREKFFIEAQSAGRLNHPNIVAIHDAGIYRDFCYITMEYIEGSTLEKYCRKESLLPLNKVIEVIFSVCHALDFAHKQGVIHRDIKPSNIMLDKQGNIKITDFGIAQMTEQTAKMGIFGTPSYMSPEQLTDTVAKVESDVFSLGCVLYELLTGKQAFSGDNFFSIMYKIVNEEPEPLLKIRPELPKILAEITHKAMAKDLKERYQSCNDLAYYLRVALHGLSGADKEIAEEVELVAQAPFFKNFSKDQIRELVATSEIVRTKRGETIVLQGDVDDTFYIILNGTARVQRDEKNIAVIGAGECFGEMSYIARQARVASVLADSDCILLKISSTLLNRAPESIQFLFYKNFAMTLVKRLSKSSIDEENKDKKL